MALSRRPSQGFFTERAAVAVRFLLLSSLFAPSTAFAQLYERVRSTGRDAEIVVVGSLFESFTRLLNLFAPLAALAGGLGLVIALFALVNRSRRALCAGLLLLGFFFLVYVSVLLGLFVCLPSAFLWCSKEKEEEEEEERILRESEQLQKGMVHSASLAIGSAASVRRAVKPMPEKKRRRKRRTAIEQEEAGEVETDRLTVETSSEAFIKLPRPF